MIYNYKNKNLAKEGVWKHGRFHYELVMTDNHLGALA
jgi:hypothetical protein